MEYEEIPHKIIVCAMEVHRRPGPGYPEYIYNKGCYRIVRYKIIAQAKNYLEAGGVEIGLLINFRASRVHLKRMINN